MRNRSSIKRDRDEDENVRAKRMIDEIIPETESEEHEQERPEKNPAAVALGRLGGLKGGRARANSLSAERKSQIARDAAFKRWNKRGQD